MMKAIQLWLAALVAGTCLTTPANAREAFCITGWIMDKYCIDRGNLFDTGDPTLSSPHLHSIHCLVDVARCRNSGFEVLSDEKDANGDYIRAVEVDANGNELLLNLAREAGRRPACTTCTGAGSQDVGFRATVAGFLHPTIPGVGSGHLQVTSVHPEGVACESLPPQTFAPTPVPAVTPAPTQDPTNVDCDALQSNIPLKGGLMTFRHTVRLDNDDMTSTNGYLFAELTCACTGWVGFATSANPVGEMIGSDAVVGVPGGAMGPGGSDVAKYDLNDQVTGTFIMDASQQTLEDATLVQNETHTVLTFKKRLVEPNEVALIANATNTFLWAFGGETLGYHDDREIFQLFLGPCIPGLGVMGPDGFVEIEGAGTFQRQWSAHGITASVAWGILAPLAIGTSLLRDLIPGDGLWFKIHMILNSTVLIMTIMAFSLAVSAINKGTPEGGDPQHFQVLTHRQIGLAIFILVIVQVTGGIFRPHAPDKDGEKKTVRFVWELLHKGSGYGLLGLSWWEVQEGLRLYSVRFGTTDYRPVFWGITGSIAGLVCIAFAAKSLFLSKDDDRNDRKQLAGDEDEDE